MPPEGNKADAVMVVMVTVPTLDDNTLALRVVSTGTPVVAVTVASTGPVALENSAGIPVSRMGLSRGGSAIPLAPQVMTGVAVA